MLRVGASASRLRVKPGDTGGAMVALALELPPRLTACAGLVDVGALHLSVSPDLIRGPLAVAVVRSIRE